MQEYEQTLFNQPRISQDQDPVFVFEAMKKSIKRQIKHCKDLAEQLKAAGLYESQQRVLSTLYELEDKLDSLLTSCEATLNIPHRGGRHG